MFAQYHDRDHYEWSKIQREGGFTLYEIERLKEEARQARSNELFRLIGVGFAAVADVMLTIRNRGVIIERLRRKEVVA